MQRKVLYKNSPMSTKIFSAYHENILRTEQEESCSHIMKEKFKNLEGPFLIWIYTTSF